MTVENETSPVEAVQPDEGQGQPATTPEQAQPQTGQDQPEQNGGFHDLSFIADQESRSRVDRLIKENDARVTAKFQEASAFRDRWAPYEELGIADLDPDGFAGLLDFVAQLDGHEDDPEPARQAIIGLAESLGIDLGIQAAPQAGEDDPIAALRTEVEELRAWRQEREDADQLSQIEAEVAASVQSQFATIEERNGGPLSEDELERVKDLAPRFVHDHDEPVVAAFDYLRSLTGKAEADLVRRTPGAPAPTSSAGRASTAAPPVDDFDEAHRLHLERRAAVNA